MSINYESNATTARAIHPRHSGGLWEPFQDRYSADSAVQDFPVVESYAVSESRFLIDPRNSLTVFGTERAYPLSRLGIVLANESTALTTFYAIGQLSGATASGANFHPAVGTGTSTFHTAANTACVAFNAATNVGTVVLAGANVLSANTAIVGSLTLSTVTARSTGTYDATAVSIRYDPLAGYEQYAKPNWDYYGAEPISPTTLAAARYFLRLLPGNLGKPAIAPGADGSISLEWVLRERSLWKLFIDIGPNDVWSGYWRMADGRKETIKASKIDRSTEGLLAKLFLNLSK